MGCSVAIYRKLGTSLAGLSLLSISYAATLDAALADCVKTADAVVCTGTDTDGFTSTTTGLNLTVEQGATVEGALFLNNNPDLIRVDGTINVANASFANGSIAVGIALNGNDGATRIENTGSISGTFTAIRQDGTSATTIVNSGSISSSLFIIPVYSGSSEILRIENSGEIFNSVATAATSHLGLAANTRLEVVNTGRITANSNSAFVGVVNAGNLATADVINAGVIETLGPNGAAIKFSGQDDRLELQAGSQITGAVLAGGGADTLMFGGDNGTFTFDIGLVDGDGTPVAGEQYQGFEIFGKEDAGSLVLTGTNDEISLFTVSGGELLLNAQMVNTDFTVSNASIAGTGELNILTLNSGGVVRPGDGLGTLNVSSATFENGSVYDAEIETDGTSDLLHASGLVTLNGGSVRPVEVSAAGKYARQQTYTILTADGGVTGTYDGVIDAKPLLKYELSYDAQNVFLTRTLLDFRRFANSFNTYESARGLLKYNFDVDPDVLSSLIDIPVTELPMALNMMTGEIHAEVAASGANFAAGFSAQLQTLAKGDADRAGITMAQINPSRFGANLNEAPDNGLSVWFTGIGAYDEVDGDGNAAGYELATGGIAGGLETQIETMTLGPVTLGLGGGYSGAHLNSNLVYQDATIQTGHLGVYGAFGAGRFQPGFAASGAASYAHHNVETSRNIRFGTINRLAEADYDGFTLSSDLDVRYNFILDDQLSGTTALSPFIGVRSTLTNMAAFEETGAGNLNLYGEANDYVNATAAFGLTAAGDYTIGNNITWQPSASLAYERILGSNGADAQLSFLGSPTQFLVKGTRETRDRLQFGLGSDLILNESVTLSLSANGVHSADRRAIAGRAGLKINF